MDDDELMADHYTTDMYVGKKPNHPPSNKFDFMVQHKGNTAARPLSPQMLGPTHDYSGSSQQVTTKCWHYGQRRWGTCRELGQKLRLFS